MLGDLPTIEANWPAATHIKAYCTTRMGGYSQSPYHAFNLAEHVDETPSITKKNKQLLSEALALPSTPQWLTQVHGTHILQLHANKKNHAAPQLSHSAAKIDSVFPEADGCFTQETGVICAILTADCLPILITNRDGSLVAALHAGWRGLAAGICEAMYEKLKIAPTELLIWLGPAISQTAFEIDESILPQFSKKNIDIEACIKQSKQPKKYYFDLYAYAKQIFLSLGITAIYGGEYCTYQQAHLFYSYRRHSSTGRMASLIWMEQH